MSAVLELQSVSKHFGSKHAVDSVSITLMPGEVFGFLGPNGAGKTTTIRLAMDFTRPTSGVVKRFGEEVQHGTGAQLDRIGYLSADAALYGNWTAAQHISYATAMRGSAPDAERLTKQFQLDTTTRVSRLSTGNKQKLGLILALMHRPKLLILDEPTRGLDPMLQNEIMTILLEFRAGGGAVLMSSHNLTEVERVCDRVGIIQAGKLVASEKIQSLQNLQIHEARVVFHKLPSAGALTITGVEVKETTGTEVLFHIKGDINPFLHHMSTHAVRDIQIGHLSLEELFMSYYQ